MVGIACVFDFLDGLIARGLNVHSEIGKQLDSLADMVSFGVVPGALMYKMIFYSEIMGTIHQMVFNPFDFFGKENPLLQQFFKNEFHINLVAATGFIITIFSAIRLAKFNTDSHQSDSFIGLPTPANTILIASLPLIFDYSFFNFSDLTLQRALEILSEHPPLYVDSRLMIGISVICSFLLIAPLPLFALKFKNFSWKDNSIRYIFLILSLVLLIIFKFLGIPLIIVSYIILSVINNLILSEKKESIN
jgi:CDP-diacylglycerol--serine O-phosphatidyltransferase